MKLPDSPIKLDGFPTCWVMNCGSEVPKEGDKCGAHEDGVTEVIPEILRRSLSRQIRAAVAIMGNCMRCADIPLVEVRCTACAYFRGAALGLAGIVEYYGWKEDITQLLDLIAQREVVPGSARNQTARMARRPHSGGQS